MEKGPRRFGKYVVEREIGRGNMGIVYLAKDPYMNREVAIKIAMRGRDEKSDVTSREQEDFFNEARIAGMLDHPNILPVYDAGIEGPYRYMVTEFIRGGKTLKDFCAPETLLPVERVLEAVFKCAKALDYAHTRGVVHRDIKPNNILLTEAGDVRICDFGIAQIVVGDATQALGLMGSPYYMSPEQVREETLTHRTDLYSLGVVMFELLTGKVPFDAEKLSALIAKITGQEPPMLRDLRPELPQTLESIIKRALNKNPEARYQSGLEFAGDLSIAFKHQKHVEDSDAENRRKFQILRGLKFFRDFLDSEVWEVLRASNWLEHPSGENIIEEGEFDDSFYILVKGEVLVKKGDKGLVTLQEGDCFGEMGFFAKAKRSASIAAATDVVLIQANSTLLERTSMRCQIRFLKVFLKTLIERLTHTSDRLMKNGAPPPAAQPESGGNP